MSAWRNRVATWHCAAAVFLVLVGSLRIAATYTVFNHTIDEPDHLAAGMEWLSIGKYRYEDQHPPLGRVAGALGPFLAGERFVSGPDSYREGYRILGHGAHYDRTLALGRLGTLLFFWISSLTVYLWAHRIAGRSAALIAVLVFTTLPPVLAHSGLITTDMALAAFTGAAALASIEWAHKADTRNARWFGVLLGLAVLSKFSALVFLPAAWILMSAPHIGKLRKQSARKTAVRLKSISRSLALVLAIAFLVVWAGYLFSFGKVEFLHARLPAPRLFTGIQTVFHHNAEGHPSYILGRRSTAGFWYYYFVVLAVKTPLAILAITLWMPWLLRRAPNRASAAMPLLFSAGVILVAMLSRINIGVRHILPVYVGLAVACGAALAPLFARRRVTVQNSSAVILLAWSVFSGALQHPDYLAYTNEIAARHPERFVADSDLDWGQDMKRLGDVLKREGVVEFTFAPFNRTYALAGHPLPAMLAGEPDRPSPGWNAVSVTMWKVFGFPRWADGVPEQRRVGKSILLWYFPEAGHPRSKSNAPAARLP